MLESNIIFIDKHRDILSFRDLAPGTVATYVSHLKTYIDWVEDHLYNRSLSSVAWEAIRSYIRWLKDWLFSGQKVGTQVCEQTVYSVFVHHLAKAELADHGFNLHSLRHAFGLHLYESDADLFSVKETIGHKSLTSTEVYLTLGIGNGRSVKSPYDFD